MNKNAPFLTFNLNAPIRTIGEFESVLALIPILDIGNVLDAIRDKVNAYIKLMEEHCSADLVATYRQRYVDACNTVSIRIKEEGSPKEGLHLMGEINTWSGDCVLDRWQTAGDSVCATTYVILPDPNAKNGVQYIDTNTQTKLPL